MRRVPGRLKHTVRLLILCVAAIAAGAVFAPAAIAATSHALSKTDRVLIVVLDRVTIQELQNSISFKPLLKKAAIGIVSSPVEGAPSPAKYHLSLGSGNISGGAWVREGAFNAEEDFRGGTAGNRYFARGGREAPAGSVVELDIFSIQKTAAKLPRRPVSGALGQALKDAGKRVSIIGNADFIDPDLERREPIPGRDAALLVMDQNGLVPSGDVSAALNVVDRKSLAGLRTDDSQLLASAGERLKTDDVVVVNLGETARVVAYEKVLTSDRLEALKAQAIEQAGRTISTLVQIAGPDGRVLVVAPTAPRRGGTYRGMSPLIVLGGGVKPGLLTSPTTRRVGIIGNMDFAPSVLAWTGTPAPAELPGRAVSVRPTPNAIGKAAGMESRSAAMFNARASAVTALLVAIALFCALAIVFALTEKGGRWRRGAILSGFLVIASAPAAFMVASPAMSPSSTLFVPAMFLAAGVLAFIAWVARGAVHPIATISAVSIVIPVLDLFLGTGLLFDSILSYSPLYGARFYGIGNEAMSVMVTAVLVAIAVLVKDADFLRRPAGAAVVAAVMAAVVFCIGYPYFGANFGGTITSVATFGVAFMLWRNGRATLLGIAAIGVLVVAVLLGFTLLDLYRAEPTQSHLGRTGGLVAGAGLLPLVPIILRKIVAGFTASTQFFVPFALLITSAVAVWRLQPPSAVKAVFLRFPLLKAATTAIVIGGIIGLLSNDSGIMIPAMMLLYLISGLLVLIAEARDDLPAGLDPVEPGKRLLGTRVHQDEEDLTSIRSTIGDQTVRRD